MSELIEIQFVLYDAILLGLALAFIARVGERTTELAGASELAACEPAPKKGFGTAVRRFAAQA